MWFRILALTRILRPASVTYITTPDRVTIIAALDGELITGVS